MHLHEYQAKALFANYRIPVLPARVATSPAQAKAAAGDLGGSRWVVKAQVHAGGRGKAGGVRVVDSLDEVESAAAAMFEHGLATLQTGGAGLPVNEVLVEQPAEIGRQFYIGLLLDRSHEMMTLLVSAAGGMDIEEVASSQPEALLRETLHPAVGLQEYQCRKLAFALGLSGAAVRPFSSLLKNICRLAYEVDANLVEINPLAEIGSGELMAIDAKLDIDDNALFRHSELSSLRDERQEDDKERIARGHGLNYITLDGDIACMVNGAGLAMATMDLIKLQGGEPANFLDVGGAATADKVAEAFKLILSDHKVRAILVNIFGGIVRCDLIAEGIIQAVKEVNVSIPVIVRLEGTNVDAGRELLQNSGLAVIAAEHLTDAADKAVAAARGQTT